MPGGTDDLGGMSTEELQHQLQLVSSDLAIEQELDAHVDTDVVREAFFPHIGRDQEALRDRRARLVEELASRGVSGRGRPQAGGDAPRFDPAPPPAGSTGEAGAEERQDLGDDSVERQEIGDASDDRPRGPLPGWVGWPGVALAAAVAVVAIALAVSSGSTGAPSPSPVVPAAAAGGQSTAPAAAASETPSAAGAPSSAPPTPTTAAGSSACGPNGRSNGPEDVAVTGAVSAKVTDDCGSGGPAANRTDCTVQVLPYGSSGQQSYTYDMYGGFFAGGVHYDLHFPASGLGASYTHVLATQEQATGMGHVTMMSYTPSAPWVPASVWQSTKTGTMRWTPDSVTLTGVVLGATATSPTAAGPVTINGTWKVYGCPGS